MPELLKYEGLYLSYESRLVLRNLSGSVESGRLYVLTGENGAGKTSLLKILSGKIDPNKGLVSGAKFNRSGIKALVGSASLFSHLSVRENLEIFSDVELLEALEGFALKGHENSLVRDLSSGYVQKVSLSIVLGSKAEILLIDEPTNFLDTGGKELLISKFKNALNLGKALVVSSHEPELFSCLDPVRLHLEGGEYV